MSLNPFQLDINNIDKKLDLKYKLLATTKQKCEWYISTNQAFLEAEKSSLENSRSQIVSDIGLTNKSIKNISNELSELKNSNLNKSIIHKLIAKKKYSSKIKNLEIHLDKKSEELVGLNKKHTNLVQDIEKKDLEIDVFQKFDYKKQTLVIKLLEKEIEELCTERNFLISKSNDFNYLIAEDLESINMTEDKIKKLESEISDLEYLTINISQCDDVQRREILRNFNKKHPNIDPIKLLEKLKKYLSKLKSDLKKINTSVEIKAKREKRVIEKIIIDGNNLCHESGSRGKFIGLRALATLIPMLEFKGLDFIIVFDSSIHKTYLYTDILNTFGNHVDFIVSDGKADETIVKLANNENYYIISNDKFIEYKDHPVVTRDRVLRHNIIDNSILINDLGIQLTLVKNLHH